MRSFFATCAVLAAPAAWAQTSGSAFLNISPSVRSFALGGADIAGALGAEALGANPANLGRAERRFEAFTSYASLIDGTQYGHIAASYAFEPKSAPSWEGVGLSATRLGVDGLPTADAAGNRSGGSFDVQDLALSAGTAARVGEELHLGLALKAFKSRIGGYASSLGTAADFGAVYDCGDLSWPLSLGFSVNNAGRGVRYIGQRDPPPTSAGAGASASLGALTALFQVRRMVQDRRTELGLGFEYAAGPAALRIGYSVQSDAGENLALRDQGALARIANGFSGGIGLRFGAVRLDYAFGQQAVEYGLTQRAALSVRWGAPRRPKIRIGRWSS